MNRTNSKQSGLCHQGPTTFTDRDSGFFALLLSLD